MNKSANQQYNNVLTDIKINYYLMLRFSLMERKPVLIRGYNCI